MIGVLRSGVCPVVVRDHCQVVTSASDDSDESTCDKHEKEKSHGREQNQSACAFTFTIETKQKKGQTRNKAIMATTKSSAK